MTPLHFACKHGSTQVVNCLLENGANINSWNSVFLSSVLIKPDDVSAVLFFSPLSLIMLMNSINKTPLHCACQMNALAVVQLLIDKGANINANADF